MKARSYVDYLYYFCKLKKDYFLSHEVQSLELLMPAGIVTVLKDKDSSLDDLSMAIVRGLCKDIREVVDDTILGPRVRLCFEMK